MQNSDSLSSRYRLPEMSLTLEEMGEMELYLGQGNGTAGLRTIDMLHGFLTCVALSSAELGQDSWLPLIWGRPSDASSGSGQGGQVARIVSCTLLMLDDILLSLADPDRAFSPLVGRIGEGGRAGSWDDGSRWAAGFIAGTAVLEDQWPEFIGRSETAGLLLPMFLLGYPSLPPAWAGMVRTPSQRHRLTQWIPAVVEAIHIQRFAFELHNLKVTGANLDTARLFH